MQSRQSKQYLTNKPTVISGNGSHDTMAFPFIYATAGKVSSGFFLMPDSLLFSSIPRSRITENDFDTYI